MRQKWHNFSQISGNMLISLLYVLAPPSYADWTQMLADQPVLRVHCLRKGVSGQVEQPLLGLALAGWGQVGCVWHSRGGSELDAFTPIHHPMLGTGEVKVCMLFLSCILILHGLLNAWPPSDALSRCESALGSEGNTLSKKLHPWWLCECVIWAGEKESNICGHRTFDTWSCRVDGVGWGTRIYARMHVCLYGLIRFLLMVCVRWGNIGPLRKICVWGSLMHPHFLVYQRTPGELGPREVVFKPKG